MAHHTLTEEIIRSRVNLTHNNLEDVKSLSLPGSYQEKVTTVGQSLYRFGRLKQLDLSRNTLSSLSGMENLKMLEKLNLYYNNISSLEELKKLQHNKRLQDIDLRLNPVTRSEPDYRLYLIQLLPNLQKLDDRCVRDRERQAAMMHFSDSPEFDISKNEEDLTPQGNPRARYVKSFVGGRTLDMDEMAVLNIISHARTDILPVKPLTGSTARQSAIEEYSLEALKQIGLDEKAQNGMATDQDSSKKRSAVSNKDITPRKLTENVHSLPLNKTSVDCQENIPPPPSKNKSSSQKNGVQPPVSFPITHEEEYQAYTKYTGHSHYTPCPDNPPVQYLPKFNEQNDSNKNTNGQENKNVLLKQQRQFEKSGPTKNGLNNGGDDRSFSNQSSQSISPNSTDRLLLQLMDLIDKYWNGTQSLQRNTKFKSLAKDIVEKHVDSCSMQLCQGLQEQIQLLTNQKEELAQQLSQRLPNSSESLPSNKAKLENSLKSAYQNLEKVKGQLEQSIQENKILHQKLANVEAKFNSEIQSSEDPMLYEQLQKENQDLCKDVEMLHERLKQYNQIQALADMLKDSHNSLIRANNHLMTEIEETKIRHSAEVHQLQWNYEQLRHTMTALECVSENPPTESGSLLSLAAESMNKPSVKLYDSDERESLSLT